MDHCLILLAADNFWSNPETYLAILKVVIGLGAVIFVHELGHFLLAKACGVKCEKFYVGFDVPIKLFGQTVIPAKLFSFQWGETEYGIGSIPLGGYVKMLGQDDNPGNIEEQIKESVVDGQDVDSAILATGMIDQSKLDPRSYLAKSVIQRMMIISAGVIFNLLFAVLLAAVAFRSGVDYQPPVFGSVISGGPAWKHNLAGAELKQVGSKNVEGYFTFAHFGETVIINGDETPLTLSYVPSGKSEQVTVEILPEIGINRGQEQFALLGAAPSTSTTVYLPWSDTPAGRANPPLQRGDRILGVNGETVADGTELRKLLGQVASQPLQLEIERDSETPDSPPQKLTTTVPRNPRRLLGFTTAWQPIGNIQFDSPAEQTGLKAGDKIIEIDGETTGSLPLINQKLNAMARDGKSVNIKFERDGQSQEVSIPLRRPEFNSQIGLKGFVPLDAIGVAIPTTHFVDSVQPDSPADKGGMQVGDELLLVEYLLTKQQQQDDRFSGLKTKVDLVKDETRWVEFEDVMQALEVGTELKLTVKRGTEFVSMNLKTTASDQHFLPERGFGFVFLERHYESVTWTDAMINGAYEVLEDLKRVGKTLITLVTGKISITNIGGPGTIATVATLEASQSTSRLLLFLTFLSANLAIVNFLPIPVLDGGHMVFLAYEGIFRRPVNERVQLVLTYGGLAFILCLMVFAISMDVGRWIL